VPKIIVLEDPLTAVEHVELGVAYERKGELDLALREYEMALRKDRKFFLARLNLGNVFLAKKEYGKAREEYLRALELRPGDPEATNNLSWAALDSETGSKTRWRGWRRLCPAPPAAVRPFWIRWAFSGCAQTATNRRKMLLPSPKRFAARPAQIRARARRAALRARRRCAGKSTCTAGSSGGDSLPRHRRPL
jgi:tetratricopeptide (TPR) repeat protein